MYYFQLINSLNVLNVLSHVLKMRNFFMLTLMITTKAHCNPDTNHSDVRRSSYVCWLADA